MGKYLPSPRAWIRNDLYPGDQKALERKRREGGGEGRDVVLGAGRDGPSWASLVIPKILDSFLPFCGKQARSWMMTHLDSAGGVSFGSPGWAAECTTHPRARQESGRSCAGNLSHLPQSHRMPPPPCLLLAHSARFLSKELLCPALLCGLAGAQGQESPAASLPAAEQAGAGGAGRAASCPTSLWQLANKSPSLKLAE